ncbi:MAG: PIN domain-containing protein [Patescibacteria group bacterium]|jgi:predicted nucleic-acid-binding protein|nr:PIN domain-containing protein [Patescibacteria group bacterium]
MAIVVSLDTNVILRFLLDDIPEQTKIASYTIDSSKVYVTDVVIVECIYVMEKVIGLSRQDITKLIVNFLGFSNVVHNLYFLEEVIQFYEQHPSLSIVDCYAATESKAYNNQLVTFDKTLANQGGKHVTSLLN